MRPPKHASTGMIPQHRAMQALLCMQSINGLNICILELDELRPVHISIGSFRKSDERETTYGDILLKSLLVLALRYHACSTLYAPTEQDLTRRNTVFLRNLQDRVILQHRRCLRSLTRLTCTLITISTLSSITLNTKRRNAPMGEYAVRCIPFTSHHFFVSLCGKNGCISI